MSIRHLLAAAELQELYTDDHPQGPRKLSPSHKLALMAIADDASDKTDHSFPGLDKVKRWASVGNRRALELIADLVAAGYLSNISPGYPGRRAVYQVHLTAPKPVDNSEKMGAESRTQPEMGAENPENARDSAPLSVDPLPLILQSHTQPHLGGARGSADDDGIYEGESWASGRRRRKAEKHLDQSILEQLVGDIYADFPDEHRSALIHNAALFVVGKAISSGSRLTDPTAYVAASIRREPEVHRRRAFDQVVHL